MDHIDTLVNRLRTYSQSLVAYKLDADFADACTEAADALEKLQAKLERVTRELDAAGEDMKCIADKIVCANVAFTTIQKTRNNFAIKIRSSMGAINSSGAA